MSGTADSWLYFPQVPYLFVASCILSEDVALHKTEQPILWLLEDMTLSLEQMKFST